MIVARLSPITYLARAPRTPNFSFHPFSAALSSLTLLPSRSCGLLHSLFAAPPFVFNALQPLFPKHPGGGCSVDPSLHYLCALLRLFTRSREGSVSLRCRFATPFFSEPYELLFPQPFSFHNHPHCLGVRRLPSLFPNLARLVFNPRADLK
jgi:hypothetical protein